MSRTEVCEKHKLKSSKTSVKLEGYAIVIKKRRINDNVLPETQYCSKAKPRKARSPRRQARDGESFTYDHPHCPSCILNIAKLTLAEAFLSRFDRIFGGAPEFVYPVITAASNSSTQLAGIRQLPTRSCTCVNSAYSCLPSLVFSATARLNSILCRMSKGR